jgi:hypothetical protein
MRDVLEDLLAVHGGHSRGAPPVGAGRVPQSDEAAYTGSLRVRRFKVMAPRPMMGSQGRNPVLTPKVTEQRRGSAHGGTQSGKAAASAAAR